MDFRSLLLILIIVSLSSCQHIGRQECVNYRTIQASPHRNSDRAKDETNRAEDLMQTGKVDQAEHALQLALVADISYGPAHNNLGQLYFSQGNYYLAAWEFEYAIQLMPDRSEPYNNLGLVYERIGKLDEAIGFFESASELQPDDAQFLGNLVRCHVRRGDRDEETQRLLSELVMRETRPDWSAWAEETIALFNESSHNVPPIAPATSRHPSPAATEQLMLPPPVQSIRSD